jgi:hypothetical protein
VVGRCPRQRNVNGGDNDCGAEGERGHCQSIDRTAEQTARP